MPFDPSTNVAPSLNFNHFVQNSGKHNPEENMKAKPESKAGGKRAKPAQAKEEKTAAKKEETKSHKKRESKQQAKAAVKDEEESANPALVTDPKKRGRKREKDCSYFQRAEEKIKEIKAKLKTAKQDGMDVKERQRLRNQVSA